MLLEETILASVFVCVWVRRRFFSPSLFLMELIVLLFPVQECMQCARDSVKGDVIAECLEAREFEVVAC